MTHSPLTNGIQLTSDSNARTARVDRFIVHHAATTSLAAILSLFQPGGRTVSANYALGSDGTLVLAVDEDRRAWTSASAAWDGRAVTIEVANSVAGGSWPVSDAAFDKLARLIADVASRYGFPINDNTVLTHQELYQRYGASYPTACPGDLQRRKSELLALANSYLSGGGSSIVTSPLTKESDMQLVFDKNAPQNVYLAGPGRDLIPVAGDDVDILRRLIQGGPEKQGYTLPELQRIKAFMLEFAPQPQPTPPAAS